ncbi:MAG TPA: ABC transporter substrate-binding protein [Burkholderiales bacterium]|nr:ABC transporter substrate-binding protein [Burkholderiales bacterium]
MMGSRGAAVLLAALGCCAAQADERLTVVLNWVPNAEHAPLFHAHQQGWYAQTGIAVEIEPVLGSPVAIERAMRGVHTLAVADFVAWLRASTAGAQGAAVMVLEHGSPYAFYFDRRTGLAGPGDFTGRRLAAQPQDPMRALWPVLAARHLHDDAPDFAGSDTTAVRWVDMGNAAKPEALARGDIDVALNPFLHNHLAYAAALGKELGAAWWRDLGFEAYGLVLISGAALMRDEPGLLRRFVAVTQRAWAQCRAAPAPCIDALIAAQPELDRADSTALWQLAQPGPAPTGDAFDSARVERTRTDVEAAFGVRAPQAREAATNRFLDRR